MGMDYLLQRKEDGLLYPILLEVRPHAVDDPVDDGAIRLRLRRCTTQEASTVSCRKLERSTPATHHRLVRHVHALSSSAKGLLVQGRDAIQYCRSFLLPSQISAMVLLAHAARAALRRPGPLLLSAASRRGYAETVDATKIKLSLVLPHEVGRIASKRIS